MFRLLGEVDKGGGDIFRFFSGGAPTQGPQITTTQGIAGDTRFVGARLRGGGRSRSPPPGVNVAVIGAAGCDFQVKVTNANTAWVQRRSSSSTPGMPPTRPVRGLDPRA